MSKLLILFITFSAFANATSFLPVSIKKQISESSGIIVGEVVNSEAIFDKNGAIQTKTFLKLDKWIGITPVSYHIEVYVPGGEVGDRVHSIEGAPKFTIGEKVVLMLKDHNEKQWVLNLGLGKFNIKKVGNSEILVNSIFPRHPKVSQISLDIFYTLASRIKSTKFHERTKNKYELEIEKHSAIIKKDKLKRGIASIRGGSRIDRNADNSKDSTFWIILILGFLGALFTILKKYDKE
jgi:hypothetical protein